MNTTEKRLIATFNAAGFFHAQKMKDTLQGTIWKVTKRNAYTLKNEYKVIKVTNRSLHKQSIIIVDGKKYNIHEDILKERCILKYLSRQKDVAKSIIKYTQFFASNRSYYLVMDYGGMSLFDFVIDVHRLINSSYVSILEWHRLVRILFIQIIDCVQYIHSKNICHFDLSLENILINDINTIIEENLKTGKKNITFCCDDIEIKLCDFGLAELFVADSDCKSSKFCGKANYVSPEILQKKMFNAKKNDIWCLGICLFMIATGGMIVADETDKAFTRLINGDYKDLIEMTEEWKISKYINSELADLISKILKYEQKRINLIEIKNHFWLNLT